MSLDFIRVILIETQGSANLGSVARAMANYGAGDLVLVNPIAEVDSSLSRGMASKAGPLLQQAKVTETLDQALSGCHWAVGFTANAEKRYRDQHNWLDVIPRVLEVRASEKVALVFGREDWGLDNASLDRCRIIARIPTQAEYSSLNLAQAVMVTLFSLFLQSGQVSIKPREVTQIPEDKYGEQDLSSLEQRERLYEDLENTLFAIGFMKSDEDKTTMRHFRRIFERAQLKKGEVPILRGLCRQFRWAKDHQR